MKCTALSTTNSIQSDVIALDQERVKALLEANHIDNEDLM